MPSREAAAPEDEDLKREAFLARIAKTVAGDPPDALVPAGKLRDYFGWGRNKHISLIKEIERGIPLKSSDRFVKHIGLEQFDFYIHYLNMSRATVKRRRTADEARLNSAESDRLIRYARLLEKATALMGDDEEAAQEWLRTSVPALGERTPLQCATTEQGARRVEDLIMSLKYGMIS